MSVEQQSVMSLKIMHGVLKDFLALIGNMIENKKKYGISTETMRSLNLSKPDALLHLTQSLDHEKLGILVTASAKLINMQNEFQNFISLNDDDLARFHKELKEVITDFNTVVGENKNE